jgi:hypothetical protein
MLPESNEARANLFHFQYRRPASRHARNERRSRTLDALMFSKSFEGTAMNESLSLNVESAIQSPTTLFKEPMDVVNHPALTVDAKMKVLEQWERDARAVATAEDGEMTGGEESMLARVRRAMRELSDRSDPKAHAATVVETMFNS